jgi:hypothetical protein
VVCEALHVDCTQMDGAIGSNNRDTEMQKIFVLFMKLNCANFITCFN